MSGKSEKTAWHDAPWPRAFLTAVQFLTRIPVPGGETRDLSTFPEDIRRGLQFFPVVGAAVGLLSGVALLLFGRVLPFPLAVILALAVEARLTGAFHEDAVADFCDAFGGGWTRDDVLRILKDSRVGSYGALGLFFAVALRAGGLIALGDVWSAAAALLIAGTFGRLAILAVMAVVPPVPAREGLAKDVGQVADWLTFGLGALWCVPVLLFALAYDAAGTLLCVLAVAGFIAWYRSYLLRRLGGVTGDCLGFAAYSAMILTTLVIAREG
ncbi:MAG: adenosylcobinamide-GDP ribazoletransferase [Deltaproteobacteria bacterium]